MSKMGGGEEMEMEMGKVKGRTLKTPDMDEMSRPKRPPPIHAKEPTKYERKRERSV